MRREILTIAALTAGLGAAGVAGQVDGTLDTAFDLDGAARVPFDLPGSSFRDEPAAVAVHPDGHIVIAGVADNGSLHRDTAVARLTASGALDPGFGSGGKYVASYIYEDSVSAVAVLSDGSILVAGTDDTVPPGSPAVILRKLSPAGAPTTSAGIPVGGVLLDPRVGLAYDPAAARIYVALSRQVGLTPTVTIFRLNEDFLTDWSYGNGGVLEIEHFFDWPLRVRALALDGAGRLVVAGTELGPGGHNFFVARATAGGALDPTFGSAPGGYQALPIELVPTGNDEVAALAVDARDRILLAGASDAPGFADDAAVLVRMTSGGALDPAFNGGVPLVVADTDGDDSLNGVAVQSDGRIVVAGRVHGPASPMFFAARYLDDGSADWSFGSFGVFTANFPNSPNDDYAVALALSGGRAVLVGPAEWSAPDYDFGVLRLASALIFADDLERGSTGGWSARVP